MKKCLYCYNPIEGDNEPGDYHEKCSLVFFNVFPSPQLSYTIHEMNQLAEQVVNRSITVPGVQPKLSLVLEEAKNRSDARLTIIGELGGIYILKPPTESYPGMPENEHLTMRIAEVFKIKTVPSSLIKLASGELAYITKRIDRTKTGKKIHMLDMFQILDSTNKYIGSMEKIGAALGKYSSTPLLDKVNLFELTIFCFLTGNNDMHLKNFSMIETNLGWTLSPAYDLLNVALLLPGDDDQLALTINGKKKKITYSIFVDLGKKFELTDKQISSVFKRFEDKRKEAFNLIEKSFLSDNMKTKYRDFMLGRYELIKLEQTNAKG